jgi:ribosomal protein S18 acetylase RimI-like enzyme
MEYSLRPYTQADKEFVYYVKKLVYKSYVEENWGEWNEEKQRMMFDEFISRYGSQIKIIIVDGQMAGFFHGENLNENNYEIGNICLLTEYQNKGIGTKILQAAINNNLDKNIHLRFFKQNPVVSLYKRLGFEITEELPYHYKMALKR